MQGLNGRVFVSAFPEQARRGLDCPWGEGSKKVKRQVRNCGSVGWHEIKFIRPIALKILAEDPPASSSG
jgi:hypothetical protein